MNNTFQPTPADVYSPLRVGLFTFTESWGGCMLVLPTNKPEVALCIELDECSGHVVATITWHLGPNEQLAEPLRVMRDECMDDEDADDRVIYKPGGQQ